MSREADLFQSGPEEPGQADHGQAQGNDDGFFGGVRGVEHRDKKTGAAAPQHLAPDLLSPQVLVSLPEVQNVPVGLFPEGFGGDGLTQEEFVDTDAQDAAQLGNGGQVGKIGPRFTYLKILVMYECLRLLA